MISRSLAMCALVVLFAACTPQIGDSCNTDFDCSASGGRVCDLTVPSGACTIFNCESLTCPDDAVCVRFRPEPARLSFTACMTPCETDDECRRDDGFACVSADEVLEAGSAVTAIEDEGFEGQRFCVATEAPSEE